MHITACGDVDRLATAIDHYATALRIYDDIGSKGAVTARINLAQAKLEAGQTRTTPIEAYEALREAWRLDIAGAWSQAVLVLAQGKIAHGDLLEGLGMSGTLHADRRPDRLDEEIERVLTLYEIDHDFAVRVMAEGSEESLDLLVETLLAELEQLPTHEVGVDT